MNKPTHTPGPWKFTQDGDVVGFEQEFEGGWFGDPVLWIPTTVAQAKEFVDNQVTITPSLADARLIAAAPDLLEVLVLIAEWESGDQEFEVIKSMMHAAIQKATGTP